MKFNQYLRLWGLNHGFLWVLFFFFVSVGFLVHEDYGLAWDEYVMRLFGYMDYNYITKGGDYRPNPFYGPSTELPLVILEVKLGLVYNLQKVFFMRHLYVHFLFIVSAVSFYFLLFRLYGKKILALIGFVIFITSPLLYSHSFFNSKDLPFLSFFTIALLVAYETFRSDKWSWIFVLALISSILVNARMIGLVFVAAVFACYIYLYFIRRSKTTLKKTAITLTLYLVSFLLITYITWPLLWSDPIGKFTDVIKMSVNYSYSGSIILFNGKTLNSFDLPWWYLPAWMGVTIPIAVLMLCLIGIIINFRWFIKSELNIVTDPKGLIIFIAAVCFLVPIIAEMVLRMPIFDGWRHMMFLYLFVLFFALSGLNYLLSHHLAAFKYIGILLISFVFVSTLFFDIKNHPYQHLYFNELVSKRPEYIRKNYEFDYWGTSYREGIAYVLKHSNKPITKIAVAHTVGNFNAYLMSSAERRRFYIVNDIKDGDYFISCYRGHPEDYPLDNLIYAPKVLNSTYMSVWELSEADKLKNIPTEK